LPKILGAITREMLDRSGCENPQCGHDHSVLFLHPSCHSAPVVVSYHKRDGTLRINCVVCHQTVCEVAVAFLQ
jgi:hypothetical protein